MLAEGLSIKALPYHAGLSYPERKKVEEQFGRGELPVVVTTAALAAGVDFPASQVIFESLAMGIEWLTVREFQQMLGVPEDRITMTLASLCFWLTLKEGSEREIRRMKWLFGCFAVYLNILAWIMGMMNSLRKLFPISLSRILFLISAK